MKPWVASVQSVILMGKEIILVCLAEGDAVWQVEFRRGVSATRPAIERAKPSPRVGRLD